MAETTTYEEILVLFKETDQLLKESQRKFDKETEEIQRATEESRKEAAEIRREADKQMKALREQLGGMCNSNGAFAEEYFATALEKKLEKKRVFANQHFDDIGINMKGKIGSLQDEFDIVLYNGIAVAIIEIKYKVQTGDLEKMAERKARNFRTLFPYYANHTVYLGIGSMSFNEYVYAKAKELGIGLLKPNGDTLEVDSSYVKAY
jgi:hypothetical protein